MKIYILYHSLLLSYFDNIRLHDLRHSCASLLIAKHTPLIQIQHWLGHSTMLTTADLYSHLDSSLVNECGESIKKFEP